MVTIRKAILNDSKDFAELFLISAPYFPILFGQKIRSVLQNLFSHRSNLFSFEHVYFAEVDNEGAGMILSYDWQTKNRENLRTGFLLFKEVGPFILSKFLALMRFNTTVGKLNNGEYYISNIAVYQKFRRKGIGKKLMLVAEKDAKRIRSNSIVLDVEQENLGAIAVYKKLGYRAVKEFSILLRKDRTLHFSRMKKVLV